MTSLAILCPGQGTQHPAMFDMARSDARVASLLEQWSLAAQLGMPVETVLADPKHLFSNQMAQPLIVAASLAMWMALKDDLPAPGLVAGYSIGEVTAYGVAQALSAADAISLAAERAKLMDRCLQQTPGQALVAVSGLHAELLQQALAAHGFHLAIQTAEDHAIVGGSLQQLPALEARLTQMGARLSVLPVQVASHTPYMLPAVAPFGEAVRASGFAVPRIPVLSGISATRVQQVEQIFLTLPRQMAETIRWVDCMDACVEAGISIALELGPGSSLSKMLQARHPAIECRSVADFRSLVGVRKWIASRLSD